jgi:hypothetical protein
MGASVEFMTFQVEVGTSKTWSQSYDFRFYNYNANAVVG